MLKEEGEFEIRYIAEKAGDFELHLWCDTDGDGTRQKLPGSPFSLHVTASKASAIGSRIIGADQMRNMPLTAGERLELGIINLPPLSLHQLLLFTIISPPYQQPSPHHR